MDTSAATLVGWVGSAVVIVAFSLRTDKALYKWLVAGFVLMAVHLALLRQPTPCLNYVLAAVNCGVILRRGGSWQLAAAVSATMVVGTALTWTGWIESGLVTVASVIATFGPNLLTGVTMRAAMLVPTCCLLVMFVTVGSLPGIALETFVLASSLVGIGRLLAGPRISPGRAA